MINKAKRFAKAAHRDQRRKYTFEPYWAHPETVAELVSEVTDNPDMICAAWLHDVVEDTPVSLMQIDLEFNHNIRKLVGELTNPSKLIKANRKTRKEVDRKYLAQVSAEAQTIKLADMIDNMQSIIENDPDFAKVFIREKDALLKVLTKGHPVLYAKADEIISEYFKNEELEE